MLEPEADKGKFMGLIPSWHHVDCFLDALESLDAMGVGPEELSGFTKLKPEVKEELKEKFISKVGHIKTGCVGQSAVGQSAIGQSAAPCWPVGRRCT